MLTKRLLIASPKYAGLSTGHQHSVRALEKWTATEGIHTDVIDAGRAPVDAARELLAKAFLESTHERMLMVDSGISFDPMTVKSMLDVSEAGWEFVAAAAPLCEYKLESVAARAAEGDKTAVMRGASFALKPEVDAEGQMHLEKIADQTCLRVEKIGGAMMLLHRSAFERVESAHEPCSKCGHTLAHANGFGFFLPAVFDDDRYGEDVAFVRRFRDAGGVVQLLCNAPLIHEGHGTWMGNFGMLFTPGQK